MFPGLSQKVAENRRVRREQLRQLLKKTKLMGLFDETLPGDKVMKAIDTGLAGGNEHVAADINDTVALYDEWVPQAELQSAGDGCSCCCWPGWAMAPLEAGT